MADDWEDWEDEGFVPAVPSKPAANGAAPDKAQQAAPEVDSSRFAGEDEEAEEEPKWKKNVPASEKVNLCCLDQFGPCLQWYAYN